MSKIDNVLEAIGQAIFEHDLRPESDPDVHIYLDLAKESYVLVQWPESQEFMDEDWFQKEAVCAVGSEDRFGSAAYFIPIKRII